MLRMRFLLATRETVHFLLPSCYCRDAFAPRNGIWSMQMIWVADYMSPCHLLSCMEGHVNTCETVSIRRTHFLSVPYPQVSVVNVPLSMSLVVNCSIMVSGVKMYVPRCSRVLVYMCFAPVALCSRLPAYFCQKAFFEE